jgi:hypothetical protein
LTGVRVAVAGWYQSSRDCSAGQRLRRASFQSSDQCPSSVVRYLQPTLAQQCRLVSLGLQVKAATPRYYSSFLCIHARMYMPVRAREMHVHMTVACMVVVFMAIVFYVWAVNAVAVGGAGKADAAKEKSKKKKKGGKK